MKIRLQKIDVEAQLNSTILAGLDLFRVMSIGTITNYFPFLEEETVDVLKDVMGQASNYYDFVIRLGQKICEEDVSLDLAYVAASHVFRARETILQEKIRKKFIEHPQIIIWTYPLRGQTDKTIYRDEINKSMNLIKEMDIPDWMLTELLYNLAFWLRNPSEIAEPLCKMEEIFAASPENLAAFKHFLYDLRAGLHESEGDTVNSILVRQKALEIAREASDEFMIMDITSNLGYQLRNHNVEAASQYVEEFNQLSMELNLPWQMTLARHYMGLIHLVRGEYDLAIECQFAACEVYYQETGPSSTLCGTLSYLYSDIEDGKQALHWANEGFRTTRGEGAPLLYATKARALILLGRLEDAEEQINYLHRMSLESATEIHRWNYLYNRGLLELKSGEPHSALETIEQGILTIEPLNFQIAINRALIALTKAEIQLADESDDVDSSGPWMVRLESHARKKNYPGIQMHAALLRAEFFTKKKRKEDAKEVLRNALEILDSPTVKTLRSKIRKMLDDLVVA